MPQSDPVTSQIGATVGSGEAGRLMRLASYASVSVASILIAMKLAAWLATGSLAMLGSLVDSILDVLASLINLVAIRHALTPADEEHRFGHGKAEALAGLGQSAFIAGSAVFLLFQASARVFQPVAVSRSTIGVAVMVLAIAMTLVLVLFQRHVVKRTGSLAIGADSLHYKSDLLMNAGVIVALALVEFLGWQRADPLFAMAIALYIMYGAWQIASISYQQLMDREMSDEVRTRIREIATRHPAVRDMHDLRTRTSGTYSFIQLHLELDGQMTLYDAHAIADEVERNINAVFPGAEVIIHQDPAGLEEEHRVPGL